MVDFASVLSAGRGWTQVRGADGKDYTLRGDRGWRNNNPGNLEYGKFARSRGAVGSDGRFAVFRSFADGRAAKAALIFDSPRYADLTVSQAISRYAPPNENNSARYANNVARAAGVTTNTKMSDLTPAQRDAFLDAMQATEGFRPGTINGVQAPKAPASAALDAINAAAPKSAPIPAFPLDRGQLAFNMPSQPILADVPLPQMDPRTATNPAAPVMPVQVANLGPLPSDPAPTLRDTAMDALRDGLSVPPADLSGFNSLYANISPVPSVPSARDSAMADLRAGLTGPPADLSVFASLYDTASLNAPPANIPTTGAMAGQVAMPDGARPSSIPSVPAFDVQSTFGPSSIQAPAVMMANAPGPNAPSKDQSQMAPGLPGMDFAPNSQVGNDLGRAPSFAELGAFTSPQVAPLSLPTAPPSIPAINDTPLPMSDPRGYGNAPINLMAPPQAPVNLMPAPPPAPPSTFAQTLNTARSAMTMPGVFGMMQAGRAAMPGLNVMLGGSSAPAVTELGFGRGSTRAADITGFTVQGTNGYSYAPNSLGGWSNVNTGHNYGPHGIDLGFGINQQDR